MESELKPQAVASVTPVWAISCVKRAESLVEASFTPVRAISCERAEKQPVLPKLRAKEAAGWTVS